MDKNDDVKKSALDSDSEIYNKKRVDGTSKEEWEAMTKKEKFNHFMYYNLRYIIIAVVAVLVVSYVIYGMRKPKTSDTFYCAMLNGIYPNETDIEEIKSGLWDYMIKDGDYTGARNAEKIFFESFSDSYEDGTLIDGNYAKRRIDVIIANEETFKSYAENGQALELSAVLDEETLQKISKDIFKVTNKQTSVEGDYGIKISHDVFELYNSSGEEYESPVLFVIGNTKRVDAAAEFIKFIYRDEFD